MSETPEMFNILPEQAIRNIIESYNLWPSESEKPELCSVSPGDIIRPHDLLRGESMSETTKTEEQQALEAVKKFAYRRHEYLNTANIQGFDDEELARLQTDKEGDLVFTVEDVEVDEKVVENGETTWYIKATVVFQVDDGGEPFIMDPDIYQCYRLDDGTWDVEWHAS